ncbi:HD domain-containing protein [Nocardioides sp.]|uniref:HD domain-containing protein n=1 Tax=Nocardioides sp. TaxID=35761 RepID=UPI0035186544
MLPVLSPDRNVLGRDIAAHVPDFSSVPFGGEMPAEHAQIWRRAEPYLRVRDNDGHTIYAYGLARALCELHPEADADVVLPAILLHDSGWSTVAEEEILEAIAPDGSRPDLVRQHEVEGARIAHEVLTGLGHDRERIERIVEIIDGHDSRRVALHLDDALVKDADKLWRITPHGVDTVMGWFGLDRAAAHRLIASRVHEHLFTDAARTIASALGALAMVDTLPQRIALG